MRFLKIVIEKGEQKMKSYTEPNVTLILLETADVLTTSDNFGNDIFFDETMLNK